MTEGTGLIDELRDGDKVTHVLGGTYTYRGWIHGSDCYIFSSDDGDSAFVMTPEAIAKVFKSKQEVCSECKRVI